MEFTDEDKKIIARLNSFEAVYYKQLRDAGMSCEDAEFLVHMKTDIERDKSAVECVQEGLSWDNVKQFVSSKFRK